MAILSCADPNSTVDSEEKERKWIKLDEYPKALQALYGYIPK